MRGRERGGECVATAYNNAAAADDNDNNDNDDYDESEHTMITFAESETMP